MYLTLYNVAGVAMLGWLLLIFLPAWRVTRWAAERWIFPLFLAVLYLLGIVPLLAELGPGMMRDFGSAPGVIRLLADPDVALVAWIHLLAFDQAVAVAIYRDNMRRRYVPLPVQSILLFLTLMFGPVGFLSYLALRGISRRRAAAGELPVQAEPDAAPLAAPGGAAATLRGAVQAALAVYRRERLLTVAGLTGIVAGLGCGAAILLRGSAFVAPEGHLDRAMSFDVAVGIYILTVVLYTPLAGFTPRGLARWRAAVAGIFLYSFTIETGQIARGIDPRFTEAGSVTDQLLGALFGITALGMIVTFVVLGVKLWRRGTDGTAGPLLLSIRYAAVAAMGAFAAGIWMSVVRGSEIGDGGSILPLHAAGFHGLQALPLVAILLGWAGIEAERARPWIHAAGGAWVAAVAALAWQTALGRPVLEPAPATAVAAASLLAWAAVAALAARAWLQAESGTARGVQLARWGPPA